MKNILTRHKMALVICSILLLITAALCVIIWHLQPVKLEGRYQSLLNENVYLTLVENGSFQISRTSHLDDGTTEAQENHGTWEQQEDGTVRLISETTGETKLIHKNQYLIDTSYTYLGEIPDGDRFDAKCTYYYPNTDKKERYVNVVFKANGVFLYATHWGNAGERRYGTYTRNGDFLDAIYDDTKELHRFIIHKDGITDRLYALQASK